MWREGLSRAINCARIITAWTRLGSPDAPSSGGAVKTLRLTLSLVATLPSLARASVRRRRALRRGARPAQPTYSDDSSAR